MSFLPDHIRDLFKARDPLPYAPPIKNTHNYPEYEPVSNYLHELDESTPASSPRYHMETRAQRRERKREKKARKTSSMIDKAVDSWKPKEDPSVSGDPYATLFVARLDYKTTEDEIKLSLEKYGPIKNVTLVKDREGRPRGYGFVEFESELNMMRACKEGSQMSIGSKFVLTDMERGRTIDGWLPRRFGGGLGGRRNKRRKGTRSNRQPDGRGASRNRSDRRRRPPPSRGDGFIDRYDRRPSFPRRNPREEYARRRPSRDDRRDPKDRQRSRSPPRRDHEPPLGRWGR
eukprot:Clim_evm40s11 gene=Clim_evmTU40s11